MPNIIQWFIKYNNLSGGEALLAREMLELGKDLRTVQFTLAFNYGSRDAQASLFYDVVAKSFQDFNIFSIPAVRKEFGSELSDQILKERRRELDLNARICGIERK